MNLDTARVSAPRGRALALALALLATGGAPPAEVRAQQPAPVEGFADLVERVAPAVVNISTSRDRPSGQGEGEFPFPQLPPGSPFEDFFREFFERGQRERERQPEPPRSFSLGSGFIVDATGFVVTNNHVIGDADAVKVVMRDETEYDAEIIGRDTKTDLALLKIQRDAPFPFVVFGDSDRVRVGDWVIAIGNPFGLGSSVSAGIISARGRDIRAGPYDDFLQVDAPINRGNSGGPSFSLDGEVIGVNTAIFSPSGGNVGIGFAIPANLAKPVVESLKASGRVARGWLGVRIQTVTDEIAESLGLETTHGALIASITPGGPAEESAMEPGDVVLRFDGKQVDRMRSLPRIVAETPIGKEVDVVVWRRGNEQAIKVTVGELPEEAELAQLGAEAEGAVPSTASIDSLGLTVANLDDETRTQFELRADVDGVVIVEVADGGAASQQDLRPGDVIVEIDQTEVHSPPEVLAKVREAEGNSRKSVLFLIDRRGDPVFVAVRFAQG
ncbi:MAG TPA: Do family serine endopeptidase [Geminicoccaceae bacterium]|nr:Do family serine endopeptidase [Geminicoccaceae bacterium]